MCPAKSSARRPREPELARSLRSWSVNDLSRRFVVGASAAGVAAADSARRAAFQGSITIIGDESHRIRPPRPVQGIALRNRDAESSENLFSDGGVCAPLAAAALRAHGSPPNADPRRPMGRGGVQRWWFWGLLVACGAGACQGGRTRGDSDQSCTRSVRDAAKGDDGVRSRARLLFQRYPGCRMGPVGSQITSRSQFVD
jgi:hypothetical protein